jgi:ubiquitin C-terminal hydrolase
MYIVLASGAHAGPATCERWAREFRGLLHLENSKGGRLLGSTSSSTKAEASAPASCSTAVREEPIELSPAASKCTQFANIPDNTTSMHVSVLSSIGAASSSSQPPEVVPLPAMEIVNAEIFNSPDIDFAHLLGYSVSSEISTASCDRGLSNLGNTCYLNALVAAMAHIPLVRTWAREHRQRCGTLVEHVGSCVACCLAEDVVGLLTTGATRPLIPNIAKYRGSWNADFAGCQQQCAHEAFCILTAACDAVDSRAVASLGVEANPAAVYTTPWWHMTGFLTASTTHCRQCNARLCKYDPHTQLSVSLESDTEDDYLVLEELLTTGLGREVLDDADDKCAHCGLGGRVRTVEIVRCPKTLFVHLKRWSQHARGTWSKNNRHVEFPITLDLAAGQHYQLRSVVIHSGSAGGGHYTAMVKSGVGDWYKYDDASVPQKVALAAVLQAEAYLIVYEN